MVNEVRGKYLVYGGPVPKVPAIHEVHFQLAPAGGIRRWSREQ
jgi:hypothetical protein